MRRGLRCLVWILCATAGWHARACSDFYPHNYIWDGNGERALRMPEANFLGELCARFEVENEGRVMKQPWVEKARITRDVQERELEEVFSAYGMDPKDREVTRLAFVQFLNDMRRPVLIERKLLWQDGGMRYEEIPPETYTTTRLDDYPALAYMLPAEFALYLRGAACYHTQHYSEAVAYWEQLLALPEVERPYRSTWAAYMLGRARQKMGSSMAIADYERTRELAGRGFSDPLDLARGSIGWQARLEMDYGHFTSALLHYMEFFRAGDAYERHDAAQSLEILCANLLRDSESASAAAADSLSRQVVSLWLISGGSAADSATWIAALEGTVLEEAPLDGGRMAWMAYHAGDMELAARWVEESAKGDFAARWVRAKLLMRTGKLEESAVLLAELSQETQPAFAVEQNRFEGAPMQSRVGGDAAMLQFNRGRFVESLATFIHAKYFDDAVFVAEGVLSLEEQRKSIHKLLGVAPADASDPDEMSWYVTSEASLRWGLARRLARENRLDEALPYYPANARARLPERETGGKVSIADVGKMLRDDLRMAEDGERSKEDRAMRLMHAADLVRLNGDGLINRGRWRSNDYLEAGKASDVVMAMRKSGVMEEVQRRLTKYWPISDGRPYRHGNYVASEYDWRAARLLPDNDLLTAQALWQGGKTIAPHDPQRADRFYKALVLRCPQLPIGQEAERARWFPPGPEEWDLWPRR